MSVRYVWGKYNYTEKYVDKQTTSNSFIGLGPSQDRVLLCRSSSFSLNSKTGKYRYSGTVKPISDNYAPQEASTYPCVIFSNSRDYGSTGDEIEVSLSNIREYAKRRHTDSYWGLKNRGTSSRPNYSLDIYDDRNGNSYSSCYYHASRQEQYPSTRVAWVSDARASAYPNYDVSGSYFYEAETQDNIDPDGVTIPDLILYGDTITITVDPSSDAEASNYGTISYRYERSIDGGQSWQLITTTPNLTQTFKIPDEATKIKFRVRAQDNIGYTSADYVMSAEVPVYASRPPTAPGSISVNGVVAGWETTVTITPSTDPDGTISYYVFERRVNDGKWTSVQSSTSLTYSETIDSSWNKVAYRAKAVDNSGRPSPYVTSDDYDILTGVIVIMGPSKTNFGNKLGKFNFTVSVLLAGTPTSNDVNLRIRLDDTSDLYNSTVQTDEDITVAINTGELTEATHTILVTASKEGYSTEQKTYTFTIPGLTLPEDGNVVTFQDSKGKDVIPKSIAQAILMNDGRNLEDVIKEILAKLPK